MEYENLVVALGAVVSWLPIPGLDKHAVGFKNLGDAVHLRDRVLRQLDTASVDLENAKRHLSFVFIGAGYAGVEALAEVRDLVQDALRHHPDLLRVQQQRWVLVDRAPRILPETPDGLGDYAARRLVGRGVELRLSTTIASVEEHAVMLSDGARIETETVVWTAGVKPNGALAPLGLPLDERGRALVDSSLRVEGRTNVWALGDCAAVPNQATDRTDPPTCQHALRQARRLAKNLRGAPRPYRYRVIGQGATLGRDKGIANLLGIVNVKGTPGSIVTRWYHLRQIPIFSRRLRVLADGTLSFLFGRDMAEIGWLERSGAHALAQSQGGPG